MKNLLFFLWMILFPLVEDIGDYIVYKVRGEQPDDSANAISRWLTMLMYYFVGYLLYQR